MAEALDGERGVRPNRIERRGFPRHGLLGSAAFVPAHKPLASGVRITLIDISQSGIGFVVSEVLAPEQSIRIMLQTPRVDDQSGELLAEVRWIAPLGDTGVFRVGCAWTSHLSEADLLHLADASTVAVLE